MKFARYGKLFPEKSIPLVGLRLVAYLDENGNEVMDWRLDGKVRIGQMLGLLELAKAQMIDTVEESSDA